MITPLAKPGEKELALLEEAVGYLNFSSGASDPKFLRTINALFAAIEQSCECASSSRSRFCAIGSNQRMSEL